MKWEIKPPAKHGDWRIVRKFAWLPFRVSEPGFRNGDPARTYVVWLESYHSHQTYFMGRDSRGELKPEFGYWHETHRTLLYSFY